MGATLSPEKILKQMNELWVTMGKQGEPETGMGVLRSCSMTLVVIADEGEDAGALGESIAALMPEHPARTIVIWPRANAQLGANVTAQCWMPFGQRRQICCEQIEITAPAGSLEDVASVISPIAAADLPLVVWCRSRRAPDSPGFAELTALAHKVVFDTTRWPDPQASIRRLAGIASDGVMLGDLSWTLLTRWREMLSQVFENSEYAARVTEISSVHLEFDAAQLAVSARYLGAWLLNALEKAGVRAALTLDTNASATAVELGGKGFHVELGRHGDRLITTVDALSHCTSLSQPTDYLLMREELGIMRHDRTFEEALARAARS